MERRNALEELNLNKIDDGTRYVFMKENGICLETKINIYDGQEKFNEKKIAENFYENEYNASYSDIKIFSHAVTIMLEEIKKSVNGTASLNELYNDIKNISSKEDCKNLILKFNEFFDKAYNKRMQNDGVKKKVFVSDDIRIRTNFFERMKKYPDALFATIIKSTIRAYLVRKLSMLEKEEIKKLEIDKLKGKSTKELLYSIGEKLEENTIKNGTYKLILEMLPEAIEMVYVRRKAHLCWEYCTNSNAIKCPKIADKEKKNIKNYSFIDSGIQVYDANGVLEKFLVTECKNYVKSRKI